MEIDDVILKEYYRCIRRYLCCSRKQKDAVLAYVQNCVQNFLLEEPDANMDDLVAAIGTPIDIANAHFVGQDLEEIRKKLKIRKRILQIIAGAVAIALIGWFTAIIIALNMHSSSINGYVEVTVTQGPVSNTAPSDTAGNE